MIKKTLLIISDNGQQQEFLTNIFRDDFKTISFSVGNAALTELGGGFKRVAAVLLDFTLSNLSDFLFLAQNNNNISSIPFIVFGSFLQEEEGFEVIKRGAYDFVNIIADSQIIRNKTLIDIQRAENDCIRLEKRYAELEKKKENLYRAVVESLGTMLVEYDSINGKCVYDKSISQNLAGVYDTRSLFHIFMSDMVCNIMDVKKMQDIIYKVSAGFNNTEKGTAVRLKTPKGDFQWFRMNAFSTQSGKILITFVNINEEKQAELRLLRQAELDELTGLYNRSTFFAKASDLIASKKPGYYMLACFDIDNFKLINDRYGTEKGDFVLKYAASLIERELSRPDELAGRITADIFVALFPADLAKRESFTDMLAAISKLDGSIYPISYSIGRYLITDPSISVSLMYDRAALAKSTIKGRYGLSIADYSEDMRESLLRRQLIINEMESALKHSQFEIWLQPQINHASNGLVGAEALVRWIHPERGVIPPNEFISVFEKNGFIYEMDKFVWEQACMLLSRWAREERVLVPISVNISRYDMFHDDFFDYITTLVRKFKIPLGMLRLEITESAFSKSPEKVISTVKMLITYGFTVEIDDFGSGYSSLNTLKDVPAQVLKLDMRFLEHNENDVRSGNVVESVVRMAKWLGMSVIAEGVERREQADYLLSIGCRYIQGYLYAKPMPVSEFEKVYQGNNNPEIPTQLKTVPNLNNAAFWSADSLDTIIFNSFVGAACIVEYSKRFFDVVRVSDAFLTMLQSSTLTVEDVLRLSWRKYLSEEDLAALHKGFNEAVKSGGSVGGDYLFVGLPGCAERLYIRITMRVIAVMGEDCLIYCLCENITAQKLSEERERELYDRLQTILGSLNSGVSGVIINNGRTEYIFANERYYSIFGYTKEQFVAEVANGMDLIHADDHERILREMQEINSAGKSRTLEYRAYHRSGKIIYLRVNVCFLHLSGMDGIVNLGVTDDISDLIESKEKLVEANDRLIFLNNAAAELLLESDTDLGVDKCLRTVLDAFDADRAFVLEYDSIGNGILTYEVCKKSINEGAHLHKAVPSSVSKFFTVSLNNDKFMYITTELLPKEHGDEKMFFEAISANTMIVTALSSDGKNIGAVGVINPVLHHSDYEKLRVLADYLAVIISKRGLLDRINRDRIVLNTMINDIPGGFVRLRFADGIISTVFVNDTMCRMRGQTREEILKKDSINALATVHPDDVESFKTALSKLVSTDETIKSQYRLKNDADGKYLPYSVFARVTKDGNEKYINVYYAELSEQEKQESAFKETIPLVLSAMLASSANLSFAKDKNFRYICVSAEFSKFIPLSCEKDIVGKTDFDIFPSETAMRFRKTDENLLYGKSKDCSGVESVTHLDGTVHFYRITDYVLRDASGKPLGIYGIGSDITEERGAYARLKLLVDSIPGGIVSYIYTQKDGLKLTYVNDGYCNILGYTREEYESLASESVLAVGYEEDKPLVQAEFRELIINDKPIDGTYRVFTKQGKMKWVCLYMSVAERSGDICLLNAVIYDVTQRVEAESASLMREADFRIAASVGGRIIARYEIKTGDFFHQNIFLFEKGFGSVVHNAPEIFEKAGFISPESISEYRAFCEKLKEGQSPCEADLSIIKPNGRIWLRGNAVVIKDSAGVPDRAIVAFSDITELREKEAIYKKWQQSLSHRKEDSYMLFRCNLTRNGPFDFSEGKLLDPQWGKDRSFAQNITNYAKTYVFKADYSAFASFANGGRLLADYYKGTHTNSLEYRELTADGNTRWLKITVELVEYPNSAEVEVFLLFENIDAEKRAEQLTRELAETDPLTGLLNRMAFSQKIDQIIFSSEGSEFFAVVLLDIDFFKLVNDTLGHIAGDDVLKGIACDLENFISKGDFVGRLGGDEFLVCLRNRNKEEITEAAKGICGLLRKNVGGVNISASVGIALSPEDGTDFETLYRKTDTALYRVKSFGKNGFAFFEDEE